MSIKAQDLNGQLRIANLRGCNIHSKNIIPSLDLEMETFRPDVVIIDPLYKLFTPGMDENAAGDMADLMRVFDEITRRYDCGIVIIHHDPKSRNAKNVNRGAGSGLLGRDFDASIFLDPHAEERQAVVVETMSRNYPDKSPYCGFFNYGFFEPTDLAPIRELPKSQKTGPSLADVVIDIVQSFSDGKSRIKKMLRTKSRRSGHSPKTSGGRYPKSLLKKRVSQLPAPQRENQHFWCPRRRKV